MNSTLAGTVENAFRTLFGDRVESRVPLAPYTTLRIGGTADLLFEAHRVDDLAEAYRLGLQYQIPIYLLAGCSNVLISDEGLRGLVIINRTGEIAWHDDYTLLADGGYNLDQLVCETAARGWADLTFAAGIPGSLGGALVGGAGAFGNLVHHYLLDADILKRDGRRETVPVADLGISYRTSEAKKRGDIILWARMGIFSSGDSASMSRETDRIKAERRAKHPDVHLPSAGSFFKNLPPAEPGGMRIPAGKLLEAAGVKRLRVGGAGVFEKHANIIVNYGSATAADVNTLADEMAARVKAQFGIELEREVQYLH